MRLSKFLFVAAAIIVWVGYLAPSAHAWCDPIDLPCGASISGTSLEGHDDISDYNCDSDHWYGKADVYRVYASYDSMLITLDWSAPNDDRLRMFVLSDCNQNHCIADDAHFLALDVEVGQDYWIIVESKRDNNVAYTLTIVCSDHPLPVELTSFAAVPATDGVHLSWVVASELNNSYFEIDREQPDVSPWEQVGTVNGRGTAPSAASYAYIDPAPTAGATYDYRLLAVAEDGFREVVGHASVTMGSANTDPALVTGFKLQGNYPNPFNPSTMIRFDVAEAMPLTLDIYDVTGRLTTTLASGVFAAGPHEVMFDAAAYPSGVYFARLASESQKQMFKMMLMK